jgi:neutral ceramidase
LLALGFESVQERSVSGQRLLVVCLIWLGGLLSAPHIGAADKQFRAGAFVADVTPPRFPISVNGNMRDVQATKAHDPLSARCLVLDDGATQLAIVVVDSCMIPREIFDRAKAEASKKTGIPAERMMMSATHTHEAVTVAGVFQSEPEKEYIEFLIGKIADGVEQAFKQRVPARIGWGVGSDPSQVFNRRWFTNDGVVNTDPFGKTSDRVRMNPGYDKTVKRETSGPVDPEVCLLSVQTLEGRPLALMANYSLHYVGGVEPLSADYFGEFANRIAQRIGATEGTPKFVGIMSNGTSGNINNVNYALDAYTKKEPFEQIQVVAASVADAAYQAYQKIEHKEWVELKTAQKEIELGVRRPSSDELAAANEMLSKAGPPPYGKMPEVYARETVLMAEYPATVKVVLQAFRIGELGIVSSPCETFVETGLAIKKASPLKPTFCIELANGYNGYLPTPEHHALGGYETWRARSSYLDEKAEPAIRGTLLELLEQVK